jgi:cytidylate kinase-like protein
MEKDLLKEFADYLELQGNVRDSVNPGFPSVTISRQMGAGGIELARMLVDRLTNCSEQLWTVFDRTLAELIWKNQDLPAPVCRFLGQEIPKGIRDTVQELLGVQTTGSQPVEQTTLTILRLAYLGNAIFVGRGANVIMANQKMALHVRLVAPFANRVRQIEKHHRLGTQEAVELIATTDDNRRRYIKHYFRAEIDDPINYHFVINTGLTGSEEAARMIAEATLSLQQQA